MSFHYRDPDAPTPSHLGVGVVALVEHDDRMLLERRVDSRRWGLVGGAVELDESLPAALCREVLEETGVAARIIRLVGIFSDPSRIIRYLDGYTIRIITFAYQVELDRPNDVQPSPESVELRFFRREELSTLDIVETHRHIVDSYLTGSTNLPILN